MRLTLDEQVWLDAYRRVLQEQHPGVVVRMVIYGSKARGDAHPDSDLDVLVIVQNDAAHQRLCIYTMWPRPVMPQSDACSDVT